MTAASSASRCWKHPKWSNKRARCNSPSRADVGSRHPPQNRSSALLGTWAQPLRPAPKSTPREPQAFTRPINRQRLTEKRAPQAKRPCQDNSAPLEGEDRSDPSRLWNINSPSMPGIRSPRGESRLRGLSVCWRTPNGGWQIPMTPHWSIASEQSTNSLAESYASSLIQR